MGNEHKFWLGFWGILALATIFTTAIIAGCNVKNHENEAMVINNAVQKGLDPIVAKCAMLVGSVNNFSSAETAVCLAVVKK